MSISMRHIIKLAEESASFARQLEQQNDDAVPMNSLEAQQYAKKAVALCLEGNPEDKGTSLFYLSECLY